MIDPHMTVPRTTRHLLVLLLLAAGLAAQSGWSHRTPGGAPDAGCWDPVRQRAYLSTATNTFEWDGTRLRQRALGGNGDVAMGFDTATGAAMLLDASAVTTWFGAWHQRVPSTLPTHLTAATYDGHRRRFVAYTLLGQVVEWNGAGWHTPAVATSPPSRSNPALAFDPVGQRVLLFGGVNGQPFGDTWAWNGQWTLLAGANGPAPRAGAALAFDPHGSDMVLYGGDLHTDTWRLSGSTWTQLHTAHHAGARRRGVLVHDGTGMLLVGGTREGSDLRDGAAFRLQSGDWVALDLSFVGARAQTAAAWDRVRNEAILIGGPAGNHATLRYDGGFRLPQLSTEPGPRDRAGLAWSQHDLGLLLFGGSTVGGITTAPLGDTWVWNGAAWQQRLPVISPPPRRSMVLQPDPRGGVLLFGGSNGTADLGDQWYWDGVGWNQETPTPRPAPHPWLVGAVDENSGDVFLAAASFGGGLATWRWNGAAWLQLPAPPINVVLTGPSLTFEPARQRMMLWTPIAYEWNGSTWQQQSSLGRPPEGTFVCDRVADRLLAFVPDGAGLRVDVATATPALATSFGAGCALGPCPSLVALGAPRLGSTHCTLELDAVTANVLAFMLVGFETSPQPIGLGCTLYVDAFATTHSVTGAAARATLPLVVPFIPALRGVQLAAQAAVLDAPRSVFGSLTATNGLRIRIGD